MPEIIYQIAKFLYEHAATQMVPVSEVIARFAAHHPADIGGALDRMTDQRLIDATYQRDSVRLNQAGRDAWNDESIVEQSVGIEYICARYGSATVHVIVTGTNGESGGSGFFCADYPGWVVTAGHVLQDREIRRIVSRSGQVISHSRFEPPIIAPGGLDLGLIRCDCPDNIDPVRIEWRPGAIQVMERLLVLGYPAIANLQPNLDHVTAELRHVARDFRNEWDSLVISSVTDPGSSGGPVLSRRGRVIGVVDQQKVAEYQGHAPVHAFTATPARYLSEIQAPTQSLSTIDT